MPDKLHKILKLLEKYQFYIYLTWYKPQLSMRY